MARQSSRSVGRPKGTPLEDWTVGFKPAVLTTLEEMATAQDTSVPELVRQAVDAWLNPQPAKVTTVDLEGAPMLDMTVACGPVDTAREEATMFYVSQQTADEMRMDPDTDWFIRARHESMEGRGIVDEFAVLMSPLPTNRFPRKQEIALVAFELADGEVKGTLKTWEGQTGELPKLVDGNGDTFELPEGIVRWWPVATAKGVVGGL